MLDYILVILKFQRYFHVAEEVDWKLFHITDAEDGGERDFEVRLLLRVSRPIPAFLDEYPDAVGGWVS